MKENKRFVLPFHRGKILHPKIVKQLFEIIGKEENLI
jgi:predicted RNA binding protein YcfA (HicA-like mRNA interferase family)